jgi:hypothetical protein
MGLVGLDCYNVRRTGWSGFTSTSPVPYIKVRYYCPYSIMAITPDS